MARRLHCVDVGTQKEELPSIFSLLTPDHLLDPLGRVAAAGIFHAIGGDDTKGMLRHILRPGILVNVSDVVDGSADGIQQRGAAPDIVFLSGNRFDLACLYPIMEHLGPVVEENGRDKGLTGFPLPLFQHGIEATDGVALQSLHRAATVQDEYQFSQILFHNKLLLFCVVWLASTA